METERLGTERIMGNVFVLGSLNMDYIIKAQRPPRVGETVRGSDVVKSPGGKGANQAIACHNFGSTVYMIGAVGNDEDGRLMCSNLQKRGLNTSHVSTTETSSGMAFIVLAQKDNQIIVSPGANNHITISDVKKALQQSSPGDAFVTQFETPLDVVLESLTVAKSKGLTTFLNPSPFQPFDLSLLDVVDYLIVNELELKDILSTDIQELLDSDISVVVTKGAKGSSFHSKTTSITQPSYSVKVVDTTAAGDAFLGCFVNGILNNIPIEENLKQSNAAGAITTTTLGAQDAIPTLNEVQSFLQEKYRNEVPNQNIIK